MKSKPKTETLLEASEWSASGYARELMDALFASLLVEVEREANINVEDLAAIFANEIGNMKLGDVTLEFWYSALERAIAIRMTKKTAWSEAYCVPVGDPYVMIGHRGFGSPQPLSSWWNHWACEIPTNKWSPNLPSFSEITEAITQEVNARREGARMNELLLSAMKEAEQYKSLAEERARTIYELNAKLVALSANGLRDQMDGRQQEAGHDWSNESSLLELDRWAGEKEGRVVVLPRARAGAKKSAYEKPAHIFRALEFLAGPYHQYRLGDLDKTKLDEELAYTGCSLAWSVGETVAGEQGDAYFVKYDGRRRLLDMHLCRGGGRDERFCMRIYFFWDEGSKRSVVGWLPSHLANSLS